MKIKKIINLEQANKISQKYKKTNKICLAHGVFDVLHIGHVSHFHEIKKNFPKSLLFVSITADNYVKKQKTEQNCLIILKVELKKIVLIL